MRCYSDAVSASSDRSCQRAGCSVFAVTNWGAISTGTCPSRSEEHTSELQSLMRISYAVFCLKKKKRTTCRKYRLNTILPHTRNKSHDRYALRKQPQDSDYVHFLSIISVYLIDDLSGVRFCVHRGSSMFLFFFNDPATTEIYPSLHTLSPHDALPILCAVTATPLARLRIGAFSGPVAVYSP